MIELKVFFENGEECSIFTVESRIDEDLKNAEKMNGPIDHYEIEKL